VRADVVIAKSERGSPHEKGSHDRLPANRDLRALLWGLNDNPLGRNSEGPTNAGNRIAIQIVVGLIA
jgi:hypothetical protein